MTLWIISNLEFACRFAAVSHFALISYHVSIGLLFECVVLSLLHCIYILIKKSMYSRLTSNLLISLLILPTQERSFLRESMYYLISYAISSLASCSLVLSTFFLISYSIYLFGNQVSDVEIPSKSLNTFLCILKFIRSSWRNVTRRGMVCKHCKQIVFFCSALDFPF